MASGMRVCIIQGSDVRDSGALHGRAPTAIRQGQVNFDYLPDLKISQHHRIVRHQDAGAVSRNILDGKRAHGDAADSDHGGCLLNDLESCLGATLLGAGGLKSGEVAAKG